MSLSLHAGGVARRASLDSALRFAWAQAGPFTVTEAMLALDLSRSTTIEALDDLVTLGFLRELANARDAGEYRKGRPSRRFAFAADAAVLVGVDAGLAHVVTRVADLSGRALATTNRRLRGPCASPGPQAARERHALLTDTVDAALTAAGATRADVLALCLGVPAPVDRDGRSPQHRVGFWAGMNPDLAELFSSWVPIVRVENDASLAAVAEGACGAAVGLSDFVALLAGERLGAGVVVDGHLLRGAHGGAGEMVLARHLQDVGDQHGLGYKISAWVAELRDDAALPPEHALAQGASHDDTGRAVFELAATGDPYAQQVVEKVGRRLARLTGVLGNMYDPERIVISGGVAPGIEAALQLARPLLPDEMDLPVPELVASPLGPDVVSIGAVQAALQSARRQALHLQDRVTLGSVGSG